MSATIIRTENKMTALIINYEISGTYSGPTSDVCGIHTEAIRKRRSSSNTGTHNGLVGPTVDPNVMYAEFIRKQSSSNTGTHNGPTSHVSGIHTEPRRSLLKSIGQPIEQSKS